MSSEFQRRVRRELNRPMPRMSRRIFLLGTLGIVISGGVVGREIGRRLLSLELKEMKSTH